MRRNSGNSKYKFKKKVPGKRRFTAQEETTLLPFLFGSFKDQSKTSVKDFLVKGQVSVNNEPTTRFDYPLKPNDVVEITFGKGRIVFSHPMLKIVWEDEYLIVIDKKPGLLSVANEKIKEKTAYHLISHYLKKSDPRNKVFVLHRLDRDTSGLMMFAKNRGIQADMQSTWNETITNRCYVAVVEGRPEKDSDLLTSFLKENAEMKVYVTASGGSEAITRYNLIRTNMKYSLLELNLETGRKNQIRAQMESIGNPIAGDVKYGAESNPAGRLMLHARKLHFIHPVTKFEMKFETPVPSVFNAVTKK
jgi:Pseudouridylate synthases, 23S RNA-specific